MFTVKLILRRKMGLTYAIAIVNRRFEKKMLFKLLMFRNNIMKISKQCYQVELV